MLLDLFLTTPRVEIEDQILNVQLFIGKTAGHVGTKYICVRLVPDFYVSDSHSLPVPEH